MNYGHALSISGVPLKSWKTKLSRKAVDCFTLIQTGFQATYKPLRRRKLSNMESDGAGRVQYDRWNEENINMNVEGSQSPMRRVYNRLCVGSTGVVVKAVGALAALVVIYIIGYVTGYYVHKC